MPIASFTSEKADEEWDKYKHFYERLRQYQKKPKEVLRTLVHEVLPEAEGNITQEEYPVVYVDEIDRSAPLTNDYTINLRKTYNDMSAAAMTQGIDPVTGLHIIVHKVPFDYSKDINQEVDEYGRKNTLAIDPAYMEAQALLHESIHDLSEKDYSEDWLMIVNELLTDSAADIALLRAQGQNFQDPNEDYLPRTGYFQLVDLARGLTRLNIISEQELLLYGFKQDPKRFIMILNERVKGLDPEVANKIVRILVGTRLIAPVKRQDIPTKAEELSKDGAAFLERECMEMWRTVKGSWLGSPMYWSGLFDYLKEVPGYTDKMIARYQELKPDILVSADSWLLIRDPEDELPTDEFAELFHRRFAGEGKKENKWHNFYDPDKLSDYLPVSALIRETNLALGQFYYPKLEEDEKLNVLLDGSAKIYTAVAEILQRNWGSHDIRFDDQDVIRVIRELLPSWFRVGDIESIDDLIQKTTIKLEGLTSSFDPTGEFTYTPSKEAVFHYGPGAKEHKIFSIS